MHNNDTTNYRKITGFVNGGEFFSGANSSKGFISYYNEIFDDRNTDRIINIIGGPGTGKSYFMKKTAERAISLGIECEKYFCSSDPSSLDAIRLYSPETGRSVGICDATEPHPHALTTPGATGTIYNICKHWNSDLLIKNKSEILELQDAKKRHYLKAYSYLKAAGEIKLAKLDLLHDFVCFDAISNNVNRILEKACRAANPVNKFIIRPTVSNSMFGECVLKPQLFGAKKVFTVKDPYGIGDIYLSEVVNYAKAHKLSAYIATDPTVTETVYSVHLPDASVSFVSNYDDVNCKNIDLSKFRSKEKFRSIRPMLRKSNEAYKSVMALAYRELDMAREAHFLLEGIYTPAINIAKKDRDDESEVKQLTHFLLNKS